MIQDWWEDWETYTPQFRSFKLFLENSDEDWCVEIRGELSDLCAQLGIQLEIYKELEDLPRYPYPPLD